MDLHELVAHIESDHAMRTRGYVVKANGWVTHQLWLVTVMSFSRLTADLNPVPPLARIIFALTGEQNDICQCSSLYEGWGEPNRAIV